MSILSKVIVVLISIASVVLSTLVVAQQQNIETYRKKYEDVAKQVETMGQVAKNRDAENTRLKYENSRVVEAKDKELATVRAENNSLRTLNAKIQADVIEATALLENLKGMSNTQAQAMKQLSELALKDREEIARRREESIKAQETTLALMNNLKQEETRVRQLDSLSRFQKEQNGDLKAQNDKLNDEIKKISTGKVVLVADTGPAASSVSLETPVKAVVVGMKKIGEEVFVSLNVGSNDKIRPGAKFLIHRGNNFVASAVVSTVDLNSAAARVTLSKGEVMVNDEAISSD